MPTKKDGERLPQIGIEVDSETKKKFKDQAKKRGLKVGPWLRMLGFEDIARNDY